MFEPFNSAYIVFGKVAPIEEVSEYSPNALADIFAFQVIVGGLVFSGLAHFTNHFSSSWLSKMLPTISHFPSSYSVSRCKGKPPSMPSLHSSTDA